MICKLCGDNIKSSFGILNKRKFYLCDKCELLQVDYNYLIPLEQERKRYLSHNNFIKNEGYVNFLNRLIKPAVKFINSDMYGLDFGCGHTKVLEALLKLKGLKVDSYDPFFFKELKREKYDFIFASECFEHFHNPEKTIRFICDLLSKNAYLFIMTKFQPTPDKLKTWFYLNDPTHVSFYSMESLDYICKKFGLRMIFCDNENLAFFKKN
ncbi:MAG: class I SAM-dependent methyltransferase [Candidatus Muiribacteriota bacterium]